MKFINRVAEHLGQQIEIAEERGIIDRQSILIEPTVNECVLDYARVCKAKDYPVTLVTPGSLSDETRAELQTLGANVIHSDASLGIQGAELLVREIVAQNSPYVVIRDLCN